MAPADIIVLRVKSGFIDLLRGELDPRAVGRRSMVAAASADDEFEGEGGPGKGAAARGMAAMYPLG